MIVRFKGKGRILLTTQIFLLAFAINAKPIDTLTTKSYADLNRLFFDNRKNPNQSIQYAKAWINKAKVENHNNQLSMAYKALAYHAKGAQKLVYLDSMISAAERCAEDATIGSAYLTKGIAYYEDLQHSLALDNYLIADRFISKTNDVYLSFKVKYQIAQTKYHLGYYHEAISLLDGCVNYFENENDLAYLNSLYALSLCYTAQSKYEKSSRLNDIGIKRSKEWEIDNLIPYFTIADGINACGKNQHWLAIQTLKNALRQSAIQKDKSTEATANFYIAKSYWAMGLKSSALPYLKKVDQTFHQQKYIRPDLMASYTMLINYYKNEKDLRNLLYYMNKLLTADSAMSKDYKYPLCGLIYQSVFQMIYRFSTHKVDVL